MKLTCEINAMNMKLGNEDSRQHVLFQSIPSHVMISLLIQKAVIGQTL